MDVTDTDTARKKMILMRVIKTSDFKIVFIVIKLIVSK
jgi:hypothetical protein